MSTRQLNPTTRLRALNRAAADLRDELCDLRAELRDCPDPRDADGACIECDYNDLCEQIDALEAELNDAEAEIERIEEAQNN